MTVISPGQDTATVQPKGFPGLPPGWATESRVASAPDGVELHEVFHRREPRRSGKILVVFHGFGEHSGRYLHFPHYLQEQLDGILIPDMRGHGRSGGTRGDAESIAQLAGDCERLLLRLHRAPGEGTEGTGETELHVFAHSFGALVALTLFQRPGLPVRSLAISAPLLGITLEVPWLRRFIARTFGRLLKGVRLDSGLDPTRFSHDPAVHAAMYGDSLCHGKVSVRMFSEMQKAMRAVTRWRGVLDYPVHFFVPLDDYVVDAGKTLSFVETLQCRHEKRIATYESSYHEAFNEGCGVFAKETAFADLEAWYARTGRPEKQ